MVKKKISYKRKTSTAFEQMSKRRRGYPSESAVKRGMRMVHGDKDLYEKLGKEDLCPCGSGYRFQAVLSQEWQIRWQPTRPLLLDEVYYTL